MLVCIRPPIYTHAADIRHLLYRLTPAMRQTI